VSTSGRARGKDDVREKVRRGIESGRRREEKTKLKKGKASHDIGAKALAGGEEYSALGWDILEKTIQQHVWQMGVGKTKGCLY